MPQPLVPEWKRWKAAAAFLALPTLGTAQTSYGAPPTAGLPSAQLGDVPAGPLPAGPVQAGPVLTAPVSAGPLRHPGQRRPHLPGCPEEDDVPRHPTEGFDNGRRRLADESRDDDRAAAG